MKNFKIEVWKSSDNKTEIHLFAKDEASTYIMGFNPQRSSWNAIDDMLIACGLSLSERDRVHEAVTKSWENQTR